MNRILLVVAVLMAHAAAAADTPQSLEAWEDAYQFDCNGPYAVFSPPTVSSLNGFTYAFAGGSISITRDAAKKNKAVSFGLLAGIKDADAETFALVSTFIENFEKADVDAIVIGGDTSSEPDVLERVLKFLVEKTKRPLLVIAGNMERAAALNFALSSLRKAGATNLINMNLTRRCDLSGVDLISLAGYHDRAFLHLSGGCIYKDKDIDVLERAVQASDDPVLFLSHGPPRQRGQKAIDYVPQVGNVGDPRLAALIEQNKSKIQFGVFGHILEAAGIGTDLAGNPLPQKKQHAQLFVNQGSANPLPWKMNDGSTSYGLAAIITIQGKKASYEVLRGAKP